MGNGKMVANMDKEHILIQMVTFIQAGGNLEKNMDKEHIFGKILL